MSRAPKPTLPDALAALARARVAHEAAEAALADAEAAALRAALEAAAWRPASAARALGLAGDGDDAAGRMRVHRMLARHPTIRAELDRRTSSAYSSTRLGANET